ncbi:hypothetical protein FA13DRAFT_1821746 [Coprinellus micaceus]|uniref:Uncharacterized protein n=1 Tax=Coprinellus micaceus TaxID=71717 RepID=A0A4Y7SAR2_COPMI|nr:hypothetical protein FA13DRAFT_1821746 [Coprinellus micaceus]
MEGSPTVRHRKQADDGGLSSSNEAGPSRLDAQLRAYHAKALKAQTKLSETLDVLDGMERTHAEQLALNERREGKMKQKMRAYSDVAKKAEEETEDMRQAVLKLIDKVEKNSNGYKSLKPSQMHVSSLLDPIPAPNTRRKSAADTDEILSYATTMLEVARRERSLERKAHQKTKEWAQSRISALEAQLSRREAELARCTTHCVSPSPTHHQPPPSYPQHEAEGMPYQQYIDTLQWTISKNRTLEREIQVLSEKLAGVRTHERKGSGSGSNTPKPRVERPPKDLSEQVEHLGRLVDSLKEDRDKWRAVLDGEKSAPKSISTRLNAVEAECARLRQSEAELRQRVDTAERQEQVRESILKQRIERLDSQLAGLALSTREIPSLPIDDFDTTRVTKRQRVYTSPSIHPPPMQHFSAIPTTHPVEDLIDDDGELSMDLATPLIPTVLIDGEEASELDSPAPRPQSPAEPPSPLELSPLPDLPP